MDLLMGAGQGAEDEARLLEEDDLQGSMYVDPENIRGSVIGPEVTEGFRQDAELLKHRYYTRLQQ